MNVSSPDDSFFRRRREDPSLIGPVGIVSALAFFLVIRSIFIDLAVAQTMGPSRTSRYLLGPTTVLAYLRHVLFPFVVWGLYAAAFYLLSVPLGGSGSFRRTFVLVGWGFLPRILTELLSTALVLVVIYRVPNPGYATTSYEYLLQIQYHPLLTVPIVVGIGLTLWAAPDLIWTYAVKHARNLSTERAFLTVSIPVGVSILLSLETLLALLNL